jgi:hypothetical protein
MPGFRWPLRTAAFSAYRVAAGGLFLREVYSGSCWAGSARPHTVRTHSVEPRKPRTCSTSEHGSRLGAARSDCHRRNARSCSRRASLLSRLFRRQRGIPIDSEKPSTRHFSSCIGDEPEGWRRHDLRLDQLARSKPASSEIIGVSVTPPVTRMLTVTPVPSASFAMIALSASSAALDGL